MRTKRTMRKYLFLSVEWSKNNRNNKTSNTKYTLSRHRLPRHHFTPVTTSLRVRDRLESTKRKEAVRSNDTTKSGRTRGTRRTRPCTRRCSRGWYGCFVSPASAVSRACGGSTCCWGWSVSGNYFRFSLPSKLPTDEPIPYPSSLNDPSSLSLFSWDEVWELV